MLARSNLHKSRPLWIYCFAFWDFGGSASILDVAVGNRGPYWFVSYCLRWSWCIISARVYHVECSSDACVCTVAYLVIKSIGKHQTPCWAGGYIPAVQRTFMFIVSDTSTILVLELLLELDLNVCRVGIMQASRPILPLWTFFCTVTRAPGALLWDLVRLW